MNLMRWIISIIYIISEKEIKVRSVWWRSGSKFDLNALKDYYFVFRDKVSMCNSLSYTGTSTVDQAGLLKI